MRKLHHRFPFTSSRTSSPIRLPQDRGLSCPPPSLLSAVGQTWKELNILHRETKANKTQTTKCKQNEKKKRKEKSIQNPSLN